MRLKENIVSTNIDYLEQININLKNIFNDLEAETSVIRFNWTGEAGTEFINKYDKLCKSFDSYNKVLEKSTSYIRKKLDEARKTETVNKANNELIK